MKKVCFLLLGIAVFTNYSFAQQKELPQAKLTVRVLDESGVPVSNAQVRIGFMEKTSTEIPAMASGLTDNAGEYAAEGYSTITLDADVRKDGYYLCSPPRVIFKALTNGMWYPWNPTVQATLRKIGNPIPMYAKTIRSDIPISGKPCGYDLKVGDWVAPYGKGETSDFIFTWTNHPAPGLDFDATAILTFSSPLDGIQEADLHQYTNTDFRWPRQAPDTGYQRSFTSRESQFTGGSQRGISTYKADYSQAYFFRVRTVEQDGKIVSALYGKIDGGIALDPNKLTSCWISFTYYLNPTPLDRNMEFDLKRNLFTNLPLLQEPRSP